ncbi:uncharacterized protein [Salmo salar]|uniref:DUF7869 domain-containing protein n=1 Tax=Salmo salar TaxID=8030 RepID=A0ABM3CND5_SALSA|nr:uncharacterized protein LOC123725654 [Salmo salar]
MPPRTHFGGKLMPSHVTKAAVWGLYKDSMTTLEVRVVVLLVSKIMSFLYAVLLLCTFVGPIYFLTPRKSGLFGVCCEGIPQQVNYLNDEGMSSSKGSSAVNYMHSWGKTRVDLNCDNCSGQNKNRFVLWYCAWRIMHKLHHSLDLHFLFTGHTKFDPDWCFGLIKQLFRKTRVNTEIAGVVKDSTVTGVNIPQLVGLEDGTVLVESYGCQQHLTTYFRPLPQIKQYQRFR